ncbi:MAG: carboxypeptidase-like regulatory domain-containing protein, partial [Bacteroidales bacterium]|nr:carboxypeptidase-like regulatory domain-containing protein [Bacteroidales bacterium]
MKAIFKNLFTSFASKAMVTVAAFFLMGGAALYAQPTVKGKVTDADGQPLIGVTVLVSGTTNGTMTDVDGNYSISVKKGDVLEFVCLGMATQSFECDGTLSSLNVSLVEDTTFLEETIVVGYGTQKKSSLTSAVSAMKGDELLKAPSTNVSQLIAGKLTGVSSVQESGEP